MSAIIEGYFDTNTGAMSPALLNSGVSGATSSKADTITVELHDAVTGTLNGTAKGVLLTNGNLSTPLSFTYYNPSTPKYIVLKGRNMIETWSASPVTMGLSTSYDFTNLATKAYGSNMIEVAPGKWACRSGDVNQDGVIEGSDYLQMENDLSGTILFGYYVTDLNGDGVVEGADYLMMENQLSGAIIFALRPF